MEIVSPLLSHCPPPSAAILEGFLWEASPATYQDPSFESCLIDGKGIAGGKKLRECLIGREEGQGLLPGSPRSTSAHLSDGFSLSLSHPCLPPLLFPLLSLSLISTSSFFFSCLVTSSVCLLPLPASAFSLSVSFFSLSSLSLLLCLFCCVSLCLCLSLPFFSPHLPSLSLSLSTVKKAKFDGAQGKWPLYLSCPVLSVCLSLGETREGSELVAGDLSSLFA